MATERTLILIKPDAVKRRLAGRILTRFEERGLRQAVCHRQPPVVKEHQPERPIPPDAPQPAG